MSIFIDGYINSVDKDLRESRRLPDGFRITRENSLERYYHVILSHCTHYTIARCDIIHVTFSVIRIIFIRQDDTDNAHEKR